MDRTSNIPLMSFHVDTPYRDSKFTPGDLTLPEESRPGRISPRKHLLSLVLGWPAVIVFGQLILLALSWGFLGAIILYRQIALPDSWAEHARQSPRVMTVIVTIIATALALFSGLLFTRAIRYALTIHLVSRSLPLFALSACIELSKGSFVFNLRKPTWTAITILCSLALSALTAGWVTLLTPNTLVVKTPVNGTEIDLGSDEWNSMWSSGYGGYGFSGPGPDPIEPVVDVSGMSAAGRKFGTPSILNFQGASFNASTSGIAPVGFTQYGSSIANYTPPGNVTASGLYVPPTFEIQGRYPQPNGFSRNYSMIQQGYTADISCVQLNGSDPSTKLLVNATYTESNHTFVNYDPSVVTTWDWTWATWCPRGEANGQFTYITYPLEFGTGILYVDSCPYQNLSSTNTTGPDPTTHLLAVLGQPVDGAYGFVNLTACSIKPRLTTVQVDYTNLINASQILESKPYVFSNSSIDMSSSLLSFLVLRFVLAQNMQTNSFGTAIASIFASQPQSQGTPQEQAELTNEILEEYLKGMVEFLATFLRSGYVTSGIFPANMTKPVMGFLQSETMGWDQHSTAGLFLTIPSTFIAVVSIGAVLLSIRRQMELWDGEQIAKRKGGELFNPTNPLHLVIASSAGGLTDAFAGYQEDDVTMSERVRIRLGATASSGAALVAHG